MPRRKTKGGEMGEALWTPRAKLLKRGVGVETGREWLKGLG